MNFMLLNNDLVSSEYTSSLQNNRGFLYGDGFFETLVIKNNHVYFLEEHFERASIAIDTLTLNCPITNSTHLLLLIKKLWEANLKPEFAIIKWIVWRDSEGLYEPLQNNAQFLLELKPYREALSSKNNVDIAEKVFNVKTIHSAFKTLSSLHYVLIGLEKKQKQLDEIIVLDQNHHLSEASSSSLFWIHNNALYTPSLDTGCIHGITRKIILQLCKSWNITTHEVEVPWTAIPSNAILFTSNIAGISVLKNLKEKTFQQDSPLLDRLKVGLTDLTFSQNLETVN